MVIVGGLVVMAIRTGQNVWRLWRAGDRVSEAKEALVVAQEENSRLQAQLEEASSPEFVEREARDKLGYGREGEVILLLPEQELESVRAGEQERPNWKKWWDVYIRI